MKSNEQIVAVQQEQDAVAVAHLWGKLCNDSDAFSAAATATGAPLFLAHAHEFSSTMITKEELLLSACRIGKAREFMRDTADRLAVAEAMLVHRIAEMEEAETETGAKS